MSNLLKIISLTLLFTINSCAKNKQSSNKLKTSSDLDSLKNKSINVGKNPDAMFYVADYHKLYVANANDDYLSVIDTESDKVIGKIDGVKNSWGFSPINQKPIVALSTHSGQIAIINFKNDSIVRQKKFDYKFGDVVTSNDGKHLYVVAIEVKKVIKINEETLAEEGSYGTGSDPDGIEISADGNTLFVTNRADGTISAIDIKENKTELIKTGGKPELINSNQNHSLVYVSNFELNTMHIIDTKTHKVSHNITNLDGPEGAFNDSQSNTLYVANFNSNEIVAYQNETFSKSPKKYTTGKNPLSIIGVKGKLYVSCYGSNSISVIEP